jgi:peptidoglycan hydrolase-like protein with peptidoglycan-binding domain
MQAKAGFVWGVRRLTVQGFSAGTVTAYRNGRNGLANNGPDRQAGLNVQPTTWEAYKAVPAQSKWPLSFGRKFGWRSGTRGPIKLLLVERGAGVRKINVALLDSASSVYTSRTADAVKAWQGARGLPQTGIVGKREWDRMF